MNDVGHRANPSGTRISTGVEGLDTICLGGLIERRRYLVRGGPGLGKTTLGLSFLLANGKDEGSLFIAFQEPAEEVIANAASVGLDASDISILSLSPTEDFFSEGEAYDVFSASEVELGPMAEAIMEAVERLKPTRVFVDSMTQLRYMSADLFQFRTQTQSFLRYLTERGATVMFTSEYSPDVPDHDLKFLCDGVINLKRRGVQSTIEVSKLRGTRFHPGLHQFRLDENGFTVFPRLRPPDAGKFVDHPVQLGSGNEQLDDMLQGGLESTTVTLITGPTGIGKSTMAGCFALESAKQGRKAAIYVFEEEMTTYLGRHRSLGLDLDTAIERGDLLIETIEPLRYLSDEFTSLVRRRVEEEGIELVVLDSVTGYELALDSSEDVGRPLHSFAKTLSRLGATVILVNENQVAMTNLHISQRGISYLCDNLIYLRYYQIDAELGKAVGVLKKRLSDFDHAMRGFAVAKGGMRIAPLSDQARLVVSSSVSISDD